MSNLRTNYKDDVFSGSRKYRTVNNADGTVSFTDETEYEQNGDTYGAAQINEANDIINNLDNNAYKSTDAAMTDIADNDYIPVYDTSASVKKKALWSSIKTLLTQVFAIKVHNSNSAGTYGAGNASLFGHVKLSDNYTSSAGNASQSIGASSQAAYNAYNTANTNSANRYNDVVGELTANNSRIYMDYKNGKYGINTSPTRGADTFIPFNPYSETVLWEKSLTELLGKDFAKQTITVPQSIQNFTFLRFDCYSSVSWDSYNNNRITTFSAMCTPADLKKAYTLPYNNPVKLGCFGVVGAPAWWAEGVSLTHVRQFNAPSDTSIWIDDDRTVGETVDPYNSDMVPYRITGIKIGQN